MMTLLLVVVALALIFDYINGFHDAANSIATVVSTKVLSPFQAVAWAAFFNAVVLFLAKYQIFGFELKVADAIAKIVKTEAITLEVILAGLLAAVIWNLATWYWGIPSSSSHTLLGGFAGAAIAKAGFGVLADLTKIYTTIAFIFLAPFIGLILAYFISIIILHLFKRVHPGRADKWFKRLQLVSSAAFSLGHGSNDAQKVMGIIAAALLVFTAGAKKQNIATPKWTEIKTVYKMDTNFVSIPVNAIHFDSIKGNSDTVLSGHQQAIFNSKAIFSKGKAHSKSDWAIKKELSHQLVKINDSMVMVPTNAMVKVATLKPKKDITTIPDWIQYACFVAIGLGTLSGGWRIIKTMGSKITKVTPFEGVAAESAGAITLYLTQMLGIPVSTTHTITGSIVGVGLTRRVSAVRWGVTIKLMWAWVLTIPISGIMGALIYYITTLF
jgi:PiT family inorganic phosphate transporter